MIDWAADWMGVNEAEHKWLDAVRGNKGLRDATEGVVQLYSQPQLL